MKKHSDWTRLQPRSLTTLDKERVIYLFEFLRHARGSKAAKDKAFKELKTLTGRCVKCGTYPLDGRAA